MRSLSKEPGVQGWICGTYHYPPPKGLQGRQPVTIVCVPPEGHHIIVRDEAGELWLIRHWLVEVGSEVQVGSRLIAEWEHAALVHLQMELLHKLDVVSRTPGNSPVFDSRRASAENLHWQIARNGVLIPPLPWTRVETLSEKQWHSGKLRERDPELFAAVCAGTAEGMHDVRTRPARRWR